MEIPKNKRVGPNTPDDAYLKKRKNFWIMQYLFLNLLMLIPLLFGRLNILLYGLPETNFSILGNNITLTGVQTLLGMGILFFLALTLSGFLLHQYDFKVKVNKLSTIDKLLFYRDLTISEARFFVFLIPISYIIVNFSNFNELSFLDVTVILALCAGTPKLYLYFFGNKSVKKDEANNIPNIELESLR